MAFAAYTDADEWEILGGNEAQYFSDRSFSDWLKRMMETDGVPLRRNFVDEFEASTQRIQRSDEWLATRWSVRLSAGHRAFGATRGALRDR